jgi:hypothetical protein
MIKALTASAAMTFGLFAGVGAAHAQQEAPEPASSPQASEAPLQKWTFELEVGYITLDEAFAGENQIGDSLYEFGGGAHYWFTQNFAATGSFAFAKMDDHNRTSQPVCPITDPNCDPEEAESEEIGGAFAAGLEARLDMGDMLVGMVDGGYKFVNFTRAIPNCSDCEGGEDINVNGAYAGVGLGLRKNGGLVTLHYRQGFGDELAGGMIHLGYQF